MSIDAVSDAIKLDRLIKKWDVQVMATSDVLVPDVKPDVEEIIGVDCKLIIDDGEVANGRILIEGRVLTRVLYATAQEDRPVAGMDAVIEFSHYFDATDVDEDVTVRARGYVEHTDCDVINSRKLQLKHVINLSLSIGKEESINAVTSIELDDVMCKSSGIRARHMVGEGSSETIVREDINLGEDVVVRDILYSDVTVTNLGMQLSDNKVLVEGTLSVDLIYLEDTEGVKYDSYSTELGFTHYVDVDGVQAYMFPEVECVVEEVSADPKDSGTVNIEAVLNVRVKVYEEEEKTLIVDAYSLSRNIRGNQGSFAVLSEAFRSNTQLSLRDTVELSRDAKHILLVRGQAQAGEYEFSGNRLYIDGLLLVRVYYITESGLACDMAEMPFRHVVDSDELKDDDKLDVRFNVSHIAYTLNGNAVDIRYTVDCNLKVYRENRFIYLLSVEESDEETLPEPASITVYVVGKGETLWDVAKRYRTTIEKIKGINELEEEILNEGDKLLILKEIKP